MKTTLASLLLFVSVVSFSQINTDRPTQSFSPHVMPAGGVQLETGFLSERPVNNVDLYNVTYLNALLRVGVTEWFELRASESYLGTRVNSSSNNGFSPLTLGTKIHINDQSNGLPQMGLLASITLTSDDANFGQEEAIKDIRFMAQEDIGDRVTLDANIGTFWTASSDAVGIYTFLLGFSASDQVSIFVEPYGFFAKDTPADHRFNAGLTYLVNDNFQLDASAGNGLTRKAPDYFLSFGASVLF